MVLPLKLMASLYPYKIFACGDHAVTVDFGNVINEGINTYVLQLFTTLKQKNIPGVKDVIPAYSSITVVYNVIEVQRYAKNTTAYAYIQQQVEAVLTGHENDLHEQINIVKIPACYEGPFAPDIDEIAMGKNITVNDVIHLHSSRPYRAYMLGFLPGFVYMGLVDDIINTPRKPTPRIKVAEGSIGIAGGQTGIYPIASPGGWNIIAQTPLRLFDAGRALPVLLQAGDYVQFYAVTKEEFDYIKSTQWVYGY